jgi:hypothetical protein
VYMKNLSCSTKEYFSDAYPTDDGHGWESFITTNEFYLRLRLFFILLKINLLLDVSHHS